MTDPAVPIAVAFIAPFEGFRSEPYQDVAGVWTIGFGQTILPDGLRVTEHTPPMSREDALAYLGTLVAGLVVSIRAMSLRPLNSNQCAALASFSYNLGIGALRYSTLLRDWNAGNVAGAEAQFLPWDHAGGREVPALERRRVAEQALFRKVDGVTA